LERFQFGLIIKFGQNIQQFLQIEHNVIISNQGPSLNLGQILIDDSLFRNQASQAKDFLPNAVGQRIHIDIFHISQQMLHSYLLCLVGLDTCWNVFEGLRNNPLAIRNFPL
jgi:hypothetical protein